MRIEVPRGLTGDPAESTTTINSLSVRVDGADSFYSFLPSSVRSFVRSFINCLEKEGSGLAVPRPAATEGDGRGGRRSPSLSYRQRPSSMWPLDEKG